VPNSVGYYNKNLGNWAINSLAFEPAQDDSDGISVFREDFVAKEHLASVNEYPTGVRVARLSAKDFAGLGLSLNPSPNPTGPAGHTSVPEMQHLPRTPENKIRRQTIRDLAQKLAQIATKNEIYAPPGLLDPVARQKK
jgi:hypothetical protein